MPNYEKRKETEHDALPRRRVEDDRDPGRLGSDGRDAARGSELPAPVLVWVRPDGRREGDDVEEGESVALAEVIFEPAWEGSGGAWELQYPGRSFYERCPGSGEGLPAETALLAVMPLEDVLLNIFTLSMLAPHGLPTKSAF